MNGQLLADNGVDVSTRYTGIDVFKRGLFSNCQAKVKEGHGRGRNFLFPMACLLIAIVWISYSDLRIHVCMLRWLLSSVPSLSPRRSQCLTDTFTVSSPGTTNPPVICGVNSGEHSEQMFQIIFRSDFALCHTSVQCEIRPIGLSSLCSVHRHLRGLRRPVVSTWSSWRRNCHS